MLSITLPDGSVRQYEGPLSVGDIAASIGTGLAKAALAGKVDNKLVDLSHIVETDANVAIVTAKDPEALELIRHSTSHLMAQAVKELYPMAEVTIGPAIENGFYYDFKFERAFTPEDLEKIEARMKELVKRTFRSSAIRCRAMKPLHISRASANTTRLKLSAKFLQEKLFLFTVKETSRICAADLTYRARANSRSSSS